MKELRIRVAKQTKSPPWTHGPVEKGLCVKCGKEVSNGAEFNAEWDKPCEVATPDDRGWADIVEDLHHKIHRLHLEELFYAVRCKRWLMYVIQKSVPIKGEIRPGDIWEWYMFDTLPLVKVQMCLEVLEHEVR